MILHKTEKMRHIESVLKKSIDLIILQALREGKGEYKAALDWLIKESRVSVSLSIFTRWILQLGLVREAHRIRREYGLKPTRITKELVLEAFILQGRCADCKMPVESISRPVTVQEFRDDFTAITILITDADGQPHTIYVSLPIKGDDLTSAASPSDKLS